MTEENKDLIIEDLKNKLVEARMSNNMLEILLRGRKDISIALDYLQRFNNAIDNIFWTSNDLDLIYKQIKHEYSMLVKEINDGKV